MPVVVRVRRLRVQDERGDVLRHAVVVRVANRARVDRHVRALDRAVRVLVDRDDVNGRTARLVDDTVGVEVELLRRDEVQLRPVRVRVFDRVHDDAVHGRVGVILGEAVVVAVDERLRADRQGGALEDAVRVLVRGLEGPVEARAVLRGAVLVHVPDDRAAQGDAGELREAVVVRVRHKGRDLERLAHLDHAVRVEVRAAVHVDAAVEFLGEPVRVRVRAGEGELESVRQLIVAVHVAVERLVRRHVDGGGLVVAVAVCVARARGEVERPAVLRGAVVADVVRLEDVDLDVHGVLRAVAPGVGHADLAGDRADELRVAGLVPVEALLAGEGRHEALGLLVLVRVLDAHGPERACRVLVHAVLVRIGKGLDALAPLEGVELPVRVVVPHLEVPRDRQARLGRSVVVLVEDARAEHADVDVLRVSVVVRVRRGDLPRPGAAVVRGLWGDEVLEVRRAAHRIHIARYHAESEGVEGVVAQVIPRLVQLPQSGDVGPHWVRVPLRRAGRRGGRVRGRIRRSRRRDLIGGRGRRRGGRG